MGCGPRNFGPEWIHIDGGDYPHLDWCSIKRLPFPDNSMDLIYASHVISYFDREEIIPVLEEWRRVLSPGGTLRLSVSDFPVLCDLYLKGMELDKILGPLFGRMKIWDQWVYQKTAYDTGSLLTLFDVCGFKDARWWNWRKTEHSQHDDFSQAYIPHMDKEHGTLISLNMEATK